MASFTFSHPNLNVQHNFTGDANILNATTERRTELRKVLTALADELHKLKGGSVQVQAEIKFSIEGHTPKDHVYHVSVSDRASHPVETPKTAAQDQPSNGGLSNAGSAQSPLRSIQPAGPIPTPRPDRAETSDGAVEVRPFKRPKLSTGRDSDGHFQQPQSPAPSAQMHAPGATDETLKFLRTWHDEWTRQGGWMFDNLTKSQTAINGISRPLEKKMDMVQDILGQSVNAASLSTAAQHENITKLIHWLEHCRKTSADKVQAREEKWRSSSATFHDTARREREAAEKRLEKKLDEQNELLRKLARSTNVELFGKIQGEGSDEFEVRSREASLGAQLTAELNNEASRHDGTQQQPFSVDD